MTSPYSAGIDFRRQNLTSRQILPFKFDPRTDGIKIIIMVVDPYHRYSNVAERADIYDDFKLKITLFSLGVHTNISWLYELRSYLFWYYAGVWHVTRLILCYLTEGVLST